MMDRPDMIVDASTRVARAKAALAEYDEATAPGATDPGSHSYRKHLTARQADKDMASSLNHYKRIADGRKPLEHELAEAKRALHRALKPGPVDPATVFGADFIRTEFGWHKVVKVNTKTVTVETPYYWTDRIPFHKITAVRKEDK